jgi:hypothetical protein
LACWTYEFYYRVEGEGWGVPVSIATTMPFRFDMVVKNG